MCKGQRYTCSSVDDFPYLSIKFVYELAESCEADVRDESEDKNDGHSDPEVPECGHTEYEDLRRGQHPRELTASIGGKWWKIARRKRKWCS